jgi:hypothetical protein
MRSRAVSSRARRGRPEQGALLVLAPAGERPVEDLGDLLPAEHAHQVIDPGHLAQQVVLAALGQAARHDDGADPALLLEGQHLADDPQRLLPGRLDEAAGVDDHHVGAFGLACQGVAVLGQLTEHALGIDQVLGAAQADEGEGPFGGGAHARAGPLPGVGSGRWLQCRRSSHASTFRTKDRVLEL